MKIENRRSIMKSLKDSVYHKEHDFIEVTEWKNGEGYDICISDKPIVSLHYTEFKVIKKLIKELNK